MGRGVRLAAAPYPALVLFKAFAARGFIDYPALMLYKATQPRDKRGRWAKSGTGDPTRGLWEEGQARERFKVEPGYQPPRIGGDIAWSDMSQNHILYTLASMDPKTRRKVWDNEIAPFKEVRAKVSGKARDVHSAAFARESEQACARMVKGKWLKDNEPEDVVITMPNGQRYGLEVKTILEGANDKVTVHPSSRARKEGEDSGHKTGRSTHDIFMVVRDARDKWKGGRWEHLDTKTMTVIPNGGKRFHSGHEWYFVNTTTTGAYRLGTNKLVPIRDAKHLQDLIRGMVKVSRSEKRRKSKAEHGR